MSPGGAGSERTMQANLDAFERWADRAADAARRPPRRELATSPAGKPRCPRPLMLAAGWACSRSCTRMASSRPRAWRRCAWPAVRAEPRPHRTRSSRSPRRSGEGSRWYQLYLAARARAGGELRGARAERGGLRSDRADASTPGFLVGARREPSQMPTCRSLKGEGVANYFSDPVFRAALETPPEEDPGSGDRPLGLPVSPTRR